MGNKAKIHLDIMANHSEVTGSCFLCVLKLPNKETMRFIVDCGLFQEEDYDEYNYSFPFDPEKIEFVLVTHNHIDHIGRIPVLYKKGYSGKVYTSLQTKIFMPLALEDSVKVLKDVCKRKNIKQLYTEKDVEATIKNTVALEYKKMYQINSNIRVTFLQNGHLVGASMILVQIKYPGEQGINVLFTGDYHNKNTFFKISKIPKRILDLNLNIVTEATYGDVFSSEISSTFKEKVVTSCEKKNTIVIPVFSLGRAQEILYELHRMQEEGAIDPNITIYFDGKLAHNYTRLYLNCEDLKIGATNFLPNNLVYANSEMRNDIMNGEEQKIIVTTSGMGSYGPAQVYLPYFISKKEATIIFPGYTAKGTLGQKLIDAKDGEMVNICGLVAKKMAQVYSCREFSAHAKADELIDLLKQFNNLKSVLINHGATQVKESFAELIINEVNPKYVGILSREYFFSLDSWGVIRTLSTKFK